MVDATESTGAPIAWGICALSSDYFVRSLLLSRQICASCDLQKRPFEEQPYTIITRARTVICVKKKKHAEVGEQSLGTRYWHGEEGMPLEIKAGT